MKHPPPAVSSRARIRIALVYGASWLPLVAIYAGVLAAMTDATLSVTRTALAAFLNALGPAVMGIAVWLLSGRLPWPERKHSQFLAVHGALSIAYAGGWVAWELLISGPFGPAHPPDYALLRYVLPWQAVIGFILYGVVAGVSYAVRGILRSRDLSVAAERAERMRVQAELATLRAHINPHFFFNTLHSVSQILRHDPQRAEVALEHLSALFRYVLHLDRHHIELVTLEEEWRFTQTYLWLEQLRMGDRLVVLSELDDDALECAVPPFTLQPLVENAVRHGLAPKRAGGTVRVMAREHDGTLELSVSDDGVGAPEAVPARSLGLGSRAVSQRLAANFGNRARSRVVTSPGHGFAVTLTFPAEALAAAASGCA